MIPYSAVDIVNTMSTAYACQGEEGFLRLDGSRPRHLITVMVALIPLLVAASLWVA